jgi:hypothetical protein
LFCRKNGRRKVDWSYWRRGKLRFGDLFLSKVECRKLFQDTVIGFLLAGVGHRNAEGQNFLVVKPGKSFGSCTTERTYISCQHNGFSNRY